jgi:hypothetical protein
MHGEDRVAKHKAFPCHADLDVSNRKPQARCIGRLGYLMFTGRMEPSSRSPTGLTTSAASVAAIMLKLPGHIECWFAATEGLSFELGRRPGLFLTKA